MITTFDCPKCGGAGFLETMKADLVEKGKFRPEMVAALKDVRVPMIDPTKVVLKVPMVQFIYDVCEKCGTEFVREIRTGDVVPDAQMPKQSGRRLGPN